ncbi:MAG: outer membrane lipoprotein carrier protein LolA [Bacteroidales bacterium]|nr:outer membrane lipoprotein carrier protein LolA [Bacteroidales bacterium]MBR1571062.1 outer membrane lipoprotein carrier protein LolA [Bacteroidales bacterium]
MKKLIALAMLLCSLAAGAQNFEGTFTQAKTMKASGKVIKSQGTISFTAPDQLAMLYTNPDGDYFIIDGPLIRMDMRGVAADVDSSNNKTVRAQRNAILYSILGKYEDIAKEMDADCTVTEKNGVKHVVIKAKKNLPKGYSGMELDYQKNGNISRMVLEEFGGISTEYIIKIK